MRNGNQGVIEMSYIEKFWRPATAADIARVIAGERAITARFRNAEDDLWQDYYLSGVNGKRWLGGNFGWTFCQVYAPPQWFLDKPEPGEGYRLLGKFPDEALQAGDEVFDLRGDRKWELSLNAETKHPQDYSSWYRRRIDPPKPEPKFAVGQRVRVVGPKQSPAVNWDRQMDKYNGGVAEVISVSSVVGSKVFYDLRFIEQWAFREDYLEPAVEPKHYTLQVGDTADVPSGHRIAITEHGVEVT